MILSIAFIQASTAEPSWLVNVFIRDSKLINSKSSHEALRPLILERSLGVPQVRLWMTTWVLLRVYT